MKKLLIVALAAVAVALAGCQNTELEECRAENAELKARIAELETETAEAFGVIQSMGKVLEERMSN